MKPKHTQAIYYLNQGLFEGLETFCELESRISQLESPNARGDAFEVFAEAYFATQRLSQATEVWSWSSVPESTKRQLKIKPSQDMGVDGVYQTEDGQLVAYQVKFRSRRNTLHWGGSDGLSTFFGLTERADQRVVITNSSALPEEVLEGRANFHSVRGHELDKLQESDFTTIREWLETGVVKREKWEPRPHQEAAIEAVCSSLGDADRATLVMACGTGKTLVALWAAERLKAKSVLILVPSLALVSQTLTEWVSQGSWNKFSFLCVCSDKSVKDDALKVHTEELPFDVTTDGEEVRRFLASPQGGTKLVFSTYQSSQVVAEGMSGTDSFDLAIFDEAHKTAGRKGKNFGFALEDGNLKIDKRLFQTATPRHYNVNQRDKEGDAKLVFSMDVPEVYGEIVHTLSFSEAARLGIICGYKIVISVVTSDMLNDEMRRRGEVIVDGEEVKAQWVANQVALQKALEETGANRVLTFHTTIKEARTFTSDTGEGIGYHLPDYRTFHISGNMPTSKRETIMKEFSEGGRSLISNARCLTEGVDVPTIDMVAFMSPKKSKVDIVQATGRAMRHSKATGKTIGYVFLPLFLEVNRGETVEKALERTRFDHIAYVLNAMKEHDDVLADEIQQLKIEKGRSGGLVGGIERVQILGSTIGLSEITAHVSTLVIDCLGSTWDEMYGGLTAYKSELDDCNVPARWVKSPRLGTWVQHQRSSYKNGSLSIERIKLLEQLGFVWDRYEAVWNTNFSLLDSYKAKYGVCNVPQRSPAYSQLGHWIRNQRKAYKDGTLSVDRIKLLESLSFAWDQLVDQWHSNFADLAAYKSKYGDCNVPKEWTENPELPTWIGHQKSRYKKGLLPTDRIKLLESLGFAWDQIESSWHKRITELAAYKSEFGDCNVPARWVSNLQLGEWVSGQRKAFKNGSIPSDRVKLLENLGFIWDQSEMLWNKKLLELVAYKSEFGDCNVPKKWSQNPRLATWVINQRNSYSNEKLPTNHIRLLDSVGFVWSRFDSLWDSNYAELASYMVKNGDCNVPARWAENPQLGNWVAHQRGNYKNGKLSPERIKLLNDLGFRW